MNVLNTARRANVSPVQFENIREKFIPLEYLDPRQYNNANRYKNLRRIVDKDTNNIYHETWVQKFVDENSNDTFITVTLENQDRLDIISNIYYETPRFWWVIALANEIIDPFDIPIGTTLRIPLIISLYNEGGILGGR